VDGIGRPDRSIGRVSFSYPINSFFKSNTARHLNDGPRRGKTSEGRHMIRFAAALTLSTALAAPAIADMHGKPAEAAATVMPTVTEVQANFARWEAALATQEPKTVAALFTADAILEPTVSNDIRSTPAEVEAYFVNFLKLSPKPTINERYTEVLDENTALDAGVWTFDLTRDGKPEWVTARFSFIWEKGADGIWRIQLLHSSLMPEGQLERPAPLAN
jgi:uncharacterized protein (TIGR02246 family)